MSERQEKRLNERGVWFAGVTRSPADIDAVKANILEFPFFAYIFHKPDDDDDRLHLHYVLRVNGSRSLRSIGKTLEVDPQFLQICRKPRGAIRYLIHLDNPEKEQYRAEEIQTNHADMISSFVSDNQRPAPSSIASDIRLVRNGSLSVSEFCEKYSFEIDKLDFYKKVMLLERLDRMG